MFFSLFCFCFFFLISKVHSWSLFFFLFCFFLFLAASNYHHHHHHHHRIWIIIIIIISKPNQQQQQPYYNQHLRVCVRMLHAVFSVCVYMCVVLLLLLECSRIFFLTKFFPIKHSRPPIIFNAYVDVVGWLLLLLMMMMMMKIKMMMMMASCENSTRSCTQTHAEKKRFFLPFLSNASANVCCYHTHKSFIIVDNGNHNDDDHHHHQHGHNHHLYLN